jgi:hypothetical protein
MKSWLFQPKAEGSKQSVLKEKTHKDAGYEIPLAAIIFWDATCALW